MSPLKMRLVTASSRKAAVDTTSVYVKPVEQQSLVVSITQAYVDTARTGENGEIAKCRHLVIAVSHQEKFVRTSI